MEADLNRIIRREFPELASGYHLPILGRIEAISDAPADFGISDHFRPQFAADIVVLDKQRNPVKGLPVFQAVPLPAQFGGMERGHYAFPEPGSLCEIAFMYGMADQLFIRQVFVWGLSLPPIQPGDVINQAGPDVYDKTEASGNKSRTTHGNITDQSLQHQIDALVVAINAIHKTETIKGNSRQTVTGTWMAKAMGAVRLLSGGVLNLAAIDNINISTASDMKTTTAGTNTSAATIHEMLGKTNARIKSPKVWVGSDTENVLGIVSEMMDILKALADASAAHDHTGYGTSPPTNSADMITASTDTTALKERLDPIKE